LPLKLTLRFSAERAFKLSLLKPKVAHGLLFGLLKRDERVGELLHRPNVKPFSISIISHFRYPEREVKRFSLRLNLLDNSLYPLISPLLLFPEEDLELRVADVRVRLSSVRAVEITSYEEILENSASSKDIVLDVLSPTSFKKGSYDYPLPEPKYFFSGLLRRWNRLSPVKLDKALYTLFEKDITVSGCWIRTKKVEIMEGAKLTGFMGRVYFYSPTKDEEALRQLNALAHFAEFSGVGRKTTMGFGTVRRIPCSTQRKATKD